MMPTLKCDSDCDYCFQRKSGNTLSHSQLANILEKLGDYMDEKHVGVATVYWLGGEALVLGPDWYWRTLEIIREWEGRRKKTLVNRLQSNLLGYSKEWNRLISEMFLGHVGSSLDYPNLYRRLVGGSASNYNRIWQDKCREASENGITVGVISLPNRETLRSGARDYISYYFNEIGIRHVHVYPPFSIGSTKSSYLEIPLDNKKLGDFYRNLVRIWIQELYPKGITITPFDQLLDYFMDGDKSGLPCELMANCANHFFCCDPRGNVMQCDCWTNFPDFRFGNILSSNGFSKLMKTEPVRLLEERPVRLLQKGDCLDCYYLAICHGGCPARALATYGDLFTKDPYCESMKTLFQVVESAAHSIDPMEYREIRSCRREDLATKGENEDM
jgi:uncharacterized protein